MPLIELLLCDYNTGGNLLFAELRELRPVAINRHVAM